MNETNEMTLRRCVFCATPEIETHSAGRLIAARCTRCGVHFTVEFDPPDAPNIRARIERIDGDDDGGLPLDHVTATPAEHVDAV